MRAAITGGAVVAQLFRKASEAEAATKRLRAAGFADVRLSEREGETTQEHVPPSEGQTAGDFARALATAGFDPQQAKAITAAVAEGSILLTVNAAARTQTAIAVLRGEAVEPQVIGPVDAEQPGIESRRVSGEARMRKEFLTEDRTITLPVAHEELVVERDGDDPVRIPADPTR